MSVHVHNRLDFSAFYEVLELAHHVRRFQERLVTEERDEFLVRFLDAPDSAGNDLLDRAQAILARQQVCRVHELQREHERIRPTPTTSHIYKDNSYGLPFFQWHEPFKYFYITSIFVFFLRYQFKSFQFLKISRSC